MTRDSGRQRGRDEPGTRVVDARQPGVGDEGDPLAGDEPRHEIGVSRGLVVAVVGEEPRANPVPLEEHPRVARVLAQHGVGSRELLQDPQRDIGEVPDRSRAHGERQRLPHSVERLERDESRADQPGLVTERGLDEAQSARRPDGSTRAAPSRARARE